MPKRAQPAPTRGATNNEYDDRELLGIINDLCQQEADGFVSTTEIGLKMGFTSNGNKNSTPAVKVASRLSWMRTGLLLESSEPDYTTPANEPGARDTRWRLTRIGHEIIKGSLSKAVETAISRMDAGAQILMMRQLTTRGFIEADVPVAFAIRREYQHNIHKRKLLLR